LDGVEEVGGPLRPRVIGSRYRLRRMPVGGPPERPGPFRAGSCRRRPRRHSAVLTTDFAPPAGTRGGSAARRGRRTVRGSPAL